MGIFVAPIVMVRRRRIVTSTRESTTTPVGTPHDPALTASYQFSNDSMLQTYTSFESFRDFDHDVDDLLLSRRIRVTDLEDVRPISSGDDSIVWLVTYRGSRPLASKRLIGSNLRLAEFVNEIVIAADLEYPTIVRLVGVAWTNQFNLQALYEYMPNGTLETYLQNTSQEILSWSGGKLQMAMDIVKALVYIHSFNPPLVHRDVRTRNVLLDAEINPKLSNFGSSRFASEQNTTTTDGIGSSRWLAPEILCGSTDYEASCDVYAFGVLLCELDTHRAPYEDMKDASGNVVTELQTLKLVAQGDVRPALSASCPPQIRALAMRCLSTDPLHRPNSMEVEYELRLLVREWS